MGGVVITGVGCVSPIGVGIAEFSAGLRAGVSGIGAVSLFDASLHQCQVAAEVKGFDPLEFMDLREARGLPRVAQFAVAAARCAIVDAELSVDKAPNRIGVLLGTSSGPLVYALEQHALFLERGARRTHPSSLAFAHNSVIASECAIQLGIHGPVLTVSSACTSGSDAIGLGCLMIKSGIVDVLLVGGADAPLAPSLFSAFERLGLLPTSYNDRPHEAARPFSFDREGLVLGEGAAVLVIESAGYARERGAPVWAEVVGYGATSDASSHFRQEESGVDASRAMDEALSSCSEGRHCVDFISAHGTGTRENDPFETRVLRGVFGPDIERIPVSSSKSQFGHLLGACGAMEAVAVVAAMRGQFLPATLNLERVDEECNLRHVTKVRTEEMHWALSVNFGFGSRNAAVLLRRVDQ